jgi:4-hydroxysphinganine ceramide fatty acyl 2-hydroxylase
MLDQVASLGHNYFKWVNLPVDKPLRLFENPILEKLSRAKWYYIPIYWIPVFILFLHTHFAGKLKISPLNVHFLYKILCKGGFSASTAVFGLALGVFIWTALEYTLHRWLFHMEPPSKSPRLITLHFLMHGLHHKVVQK